MIVEPDEVIDRACPRPKRVQRASIQALVIDGAKEALDFTVRLGRARAEQVVPNPQGRTRLLEARQTVRMLRVAHREGKRVVRQHGFDPIRQRLDDPLEKPCRGEARLIEANPNDRFAAKVIDGGKLVVVPSISEGRQELNIDVDQLARPLLLVPLRAGPDRSRQAILPDSFEHALDRAASPAQRQRNMRSALAPGAQREDGAYLAGKQLRRRMKRAPTTRLESGQIGGLIPTPPPTQNLAPHRELLTQCLECHAFLMHRHQFGSEYRVVSHASHAASSKRRILVM